MEYGIHFFSQVLQEYNHKRDRSHKAPNMTRKIFMQLGRMKERKKEMTRDQQALWGTEVRRAASEKPTHSRGISWSRKEYLRNYRGT